MKTTVGLWIDRRTAVIVFVTGNDEEIKLIYSNMKRSHRQSGVSVPTNDLPQRELMGDLNGYYDEVISSLWNSGAILIMGPGETTGELKKRLEINNPKGRKVEVETIDTMTDHQIVAKAREHSLRERIVVPELSHAMVARWRGRPVHSITLFVRGRMAQLEKDAEDATTEFLVSVVGPIVSAAIGCVCLMPAWLLVWTMVMEQTMPLLVMLVWLGCIIIGLAIFNLLPGFPISNLSTIGRNSLPGHPTIQRASKVGGIF